MSDVKILFNTGEEMESTGNAFPDIAKLEQEFNENSESDWTIPEAFLCLLLEAAFADGSLAMEEKEEIAALVKRSRTMKRLSPQQMAAVNQTVNERMRERKDGLREACLALPVDMRLSVYAHCVDIVLADRQLRENEEDFLARIAEVMQLDEDMVKAIRTVMLIKNRY
ncbi:tellurite resistance TerB family protein [Henriciella aquimarina]|uniref:tellurite resistance TerB family protein n=1 Tax=Henriciella aquimarina TaxID=545261 RepID=UPI001301CE47|nr:tellurite resistance TerB family protein [Henriciella aquimarina]